MSYLRHLKDILDESGIEVTLENKQRIDRAIHRLADIEYKNCQVTWQRLKQDILKDEQKRQQFIQELKEAIG